MTNREIKNLLKMLYDQLEMIRAYEQEFMDKEGKRRVNERIDGILDRINYLTKLLKKRNNGQ
jgi:uncharacterized protein YyaL (SSP411 family)